MLVDGTVPFGTDPNPLNPLRIPHLSVASGTLRLTSEISLTNSPVSVNNAASRMELLYDEPPGHPVVNILNWGGGATVDVSRATSGLPDGKTTRIATFNSGGAATHILTSGHERRLRVDVVSITGMSGGEKGASTLFAASGLFDIGRMIAPLDAAGYGSYLLGGNTQTNVVRGPISDAHTAHTLGLGKSGAGVWRLESPGDYSGATTVHGGGRLIVAADEALGFGGGARPHASNDWPTQINNGGILEITGAGITERIQMQNNATLVNDTPGTLGVVRDGVAHLRLHSTAPGFKLADAGKNLDLSAGGGAGATAEIGGLRMNSNSVTISGGTGYANNDQIHFFSPAGTPARVIVNAVSGGAVTGHHLDNIRPGHGYTVHPIPYTKPNNRVGETVVFHDHFTLGGIRVTNPGRGGGYRENFPVFLPPDVLVQGVAMTAVVAIVHMDGAWFGTVYQFGGNGDLRIESPITNQGNDGTFRKIGSGALSLASSNAFNLVVSVMGGALSACNTSGSATGVHRVTVDPGAMLAGSGTFKPDVARVGNNRSILLQPGAGIAPHRGTGLPFATLTCNVADNPRLDAMLMEGDNFFEFAVGPGGADKLVVIGNLTLGAGVNKVRIVPKPGITPGTYRVLEWQGDVVDLGVEWQPEPDPKWQFKFFPDATGAWLSVTSPATLFMVR
jgi:autotransporter-associated beta strand protein